MSKENVQTLELGSTVTAVTIDGRHLGPLQELHYVLATVQTSEDGELIDLRFEIVEDRFMLKRDSYTDAINEIEAVYVSDSDINLEWLAVMISQPMPGIGRKSTHTMAVGDNIEVNAFALYGLPGATRDVVLGTVQNIIAYP